MNAPSSDLFADERTQIMLASPTDLPGFRRAARRLVASRTKPEHVAWHTTGVANESGTPDTDDAPAIGISADFTALCKTVILHSDPTRFELLYRLLWRMAHNPSLQHDPLDADMLQAEHLAKAVRRDMHKMKAFVRFRTVQDNTFRTHPAGGPLDRKSVV